MACHMMHASNKVLNIKVPNSQILGADLLVMLNILHPYPATMVHRRCSLSNLNSNYHNSPNQDTTLDQDRYQLQMPQWHMHFLKIIHQTILHSVLVRFRYAYIPVRCFQTNTSSPQKFLRHSSGRLTLNLDFQHRKQPTLNTHNLMRNTAILTTTQT